MEPNIDQQRAREFTGKLLSLYTGGILSFMVDIGHQTGLFEAAAKGPGTSQELAERAGLHERYVREWLGAMTTGGIFTYDPASRTYTLPREHAACLTDSGGPNLAPMSNLVTLLGKYVTRVAACFHQGGGIPYSEFRPEFTTHQDTGSRSRHDAFLLNGYLPAAKGLQERLHTGIHVADIGCGTGHAVNLMAGAYPASTFVGYDIGEDAIAVGIAEAQAMGVSNARFEVWDVTKLPPTPIFDLITAFDSIHDQADPATVLRRVSDALAPDGTFLMVDIKASSNLEENIGNPLAPFLYGVSTLHCMTVSLAYNGAGLGTAWGKQLACRMLSEAGFTNIEVVDASDQMNSIYISRK